MLCTCPERVILKVYYCVVNWAGALIWRGQAYNQHKIGEQGMSHSSGRDDCVDRSIRSGPRCCYGVKIEKEQTGMESWLWNMGMEGESAGKEKKGRFVQMHGE